VGRLNSSLGTDVWVMVGRAIGVLVGLSVGVATGVLVGGAGVSAVTVTRTVAFGVETPATGAGVAGATWRPHPISNKTISMLNLFSMINDNSFIT
jgi:hypothetical protein